MKGVSQKYRLPTLPGLPSVISSVALVDGPLPCDRQGGPMTGPCGVGPRLASHSVPQEDAEASPTKGTSGRSSSGLSRSVALTQFLANRLHARTALLGSTLWQQTWKLKVTPLGRLLPALVVSVRRTSAKDCTGLLIPTRPKLAGWVTPLARDWKETGIRYREGRLQKDVLPRQARVFLERERERERGQTARPGPTNGFWAYADWLLCGDGRWRPVKPYSFPLAPGLPGRMGRLRGYGNALCVPQAQAFIEAFLDYQQSLEEGE